MKSIIDRMLGKTLDHVDVIGFNEVFPAQWLAACKDLELDLAKRASLHAHFAFEMRVL